MRSCVAALVAGLFFATGGEGIAQEGGSQAAGFLSSARLAEIAANVPPAPAPGSAEEVADREISRRMANLEDTDRWLLATRHAELRPTLALAHFDCALGFRIEATQAPRLVAVLTRVLHDANEAAELAKARTMRPRPVGEDPERRSCQVATPAQRATASHPSGSASVGMAYGVVMAALVPDRAETVTEIGRQIAVSRMICAMHYPTDVEDGAVLGAAVAQAILATPTFDSEVEAVGREIAAARHLALTSPGCAAERAALAIPLP